MFCFVSFRFVSFNSILSYFTAEFRSYFEHVRSLRFEDRPDYDYLKRLFRELFFRKGFSYDNIFDWDCLSPYGGPPPDTSGGPDEGAGAAGAVNDDVRTDVNDNDGQRVATAASQGDTFMAYRSGVGGGGGGGSK